MVKQIKIFEGNNVKIVVDKVNEFLADIDFNVLDIKYCISSLNDKTTGNTNYVNSVLVIYSDC